MRTITRNGFTNDRRHLFASGLRYKDKNKALAESYKTAPRRRKRIAVAVAFLLIAPPAAIIAAVYLLP